MTWEGRANIAPERAEGPESFQAIHLAMAAIRHAAQEEGVDPGTLRFSIHAPARVQGVLVPGPYVIRGTTDSGEWNP